MAYRTQVLNPPDALVLGIEYTDFYQPLMKIPVPLIKTSCFCSESHVSTFKRRCELYLLIQAARIGTGGTWYPGTHFLVNSM